MRILANENVSASVIKRLRADGHDVLSAKESMRGQTDRAILECAQKEERLLSTHDKDFGELAFGWGLPASCGVILLRLTGAKAHVDCQRAIAALESRTDWVGHFSVVTDNRIRMRRLRSLAASKGDASDR